MRESEIFTFTISEIDFYIVNKVREMRVAKNVSQVSLSISMGLAEGAIGKIENLKERAKYNIRHLNLLAKVLKCSPKDFLPEKPLRGDMLNVTVKINQNDRSSKKDASFEIIKIEPADD